MREHSIAPVGKGRIITAMVITSTSVLLVFDRAYWLKLMSPDAGLTRENCFEERADEIDFLSQRLQPGATRDSRGGNGTKTRNTWHASRRVTLRSNVAFCVTRACKSSFAFFRDRVLATSHSRRKNSVSNSDSAITSWDLISRIWLQ